MTLLPDPAYLVIALAVILTVDVLLSLRPVQFVADCLDGVQFPRQWWWALIHIKLLAIGGLVAGLWYPGVGLAANIGVVAYFVAAGIGHIRAKFTGQTFWLNCLGMLAVATAVLVVAFLV